MVRLDWAPRPTQGRITHTCGMTPFTTGAPAYSSSSKKKACPVLKTGYNGHVFRTGEEPMMMNSNARQAERAPDGPTFKRRRLEARRTQAQVASILGVLERQVQRWEAGTQAIPLAAWRFFKMTCGRRVPQDFADQADGHTRGWDLARDQRRTTIENGDFVHLQPVVGPMLRARVWLDRVHDGLIDNESYGGVVIGFPGLPDAGPEFDGFFLGEHITFAERNVVHVEQRVPSAPASAGE